MEDATYRDMTEEHLGDSATADDLAAFVTACATYQEQTDCTDAEATDYVWDGGSWYPRVDVATPGHTPGPWQLHSPTEGNPTTGDGSYSITAVINGDTEVEGVIARIVPKDWHETPANARLIASMPEFLNAIEVAGRIVGQVLDTSTMTSRERSVALSKAFDALGTTYFKATGTPLEWWQYEPANAQPKEEVTQRVSAPLTTHIANV
jgi:hypothetical protein